MRIKRFNDFDQFASSISGVESKMMMRNPQRRSWTINHVQVGDIEVQVGKLGSGNIAAGELRADGFMIYLPLTEGLEYVANGVLMAPGSICVLEPSAEFCISTKAQHDWAAVSLPYDRFPDSFVDSFSRSCHVTDPDQELTASFLAAIGEIMNAAQACPNFESSHAATSAAAEIERLASQTINHKPGGDAANAGRPRVSRSEILRRAMAFLDQNAGQDVQIGRLAEASGVSERTLRTAFTEYYGVAPVRFLRLRHLHAIRRELLDSEPEQTSVTNILARHGEWAFSRFARQYSQLFGELPSTTLARAGA